MENLRETHRYKGFTLDEDLAKVFESIRSGTFGDAKAFESLIASIADHGDYYLVSDDFKSYRSVARMGFFSTDRVIDEYAESIWNVEPLVVE